ncbi:MAG: regulatory protein TetR [Symbiobacteriaceae bacterium]|jgi:AcrR family transcriptional regulator|nr:regulatory protein TetR [Symbiobacteriaceae bacterium]
MGRRETAKDQKRTALIQAGMELFTSQGFAKTSVDQIATQADVAKGTFYNYFTTKEDLLVAGMMVEQEGLAAVERPVIFALPTVRERLNRLIAWSAGWIAENPELAVVWCQERCRRGVGQDGPSGFDLLLLDVVEAGQQAGELRDDRPPALLSLDITAITVTYIFAWYGSGLGFDLAQAVQQAVDTYLTGAIVKGEKV